MTEPQDRGIKIELNGASIGRIIIGGVDLAKYIRGLRVDAVPGYPPCVEIDFLGNALDLRLVEDVLVRISMKTMMEIQATAPSEAVCFDCGADHMEHFYTAKSAGYALCPTCFERRAEAGRARESSGAMTPDATTQETPERQAAERQDGA